MQIFQVGIPAGIQSTVINLSNVLLQSSVNSFGSIAMAGYTAANNLFGFLYVSVNSVTQACMSFTSQNYGVGKLKRMDRVLRDCIILFRQRIAGTGRWCVCFWFRKSCRFILRILRLSSVRWKSFCIPQLLIFSVVLWICFREHCVEWDIQQYR